MMLVDAGDWIALAALVIAIIVAILQYSLQKRLGAIEEERRSEELASRSVAQVTCTKRKEPTSRGKLATWIVFRNIGQATARGVWFESEPLSSLILEDEESHFPHLMPEQEWKILADPTMGLPERIAFQYGWTDDAGEHQEEIVYSVYT